MSGEGAASRVADARDERRPHRSGEERARNERVDERDKTHRERTTSAESDSSVARTPGQTVGPFFGYALPYEGCDALVPYGHPAALRLHGVVRDGAGEPVPDALLEIWQADERGTVVRAAGSLHRDGFTFTGWGRAATNNAGEYSFNTVEPGAVEPGRARFFAMTVFARGLLDRLFTRAYVPDDAALGDDALLGSLPEDRRRTLVAARDQDGLHFDVVLQGPDETVFLDFPGPAVGL